MKEMTFLKQAGKALAMMGFSNDHKRQPPSSFPANPSSDIIPIKKITVETFSNSLFMKHFYARKWTLGFLFWAILVCCQMVNGQIITIVASNTTAAIPKGDGGTSTAAFVKQPNQANSFSLHPSF